MAENHQSAPVDPSSMVTRSRLRNNAIANYISRGWATIVGLACLPLFLSLLGREAYGLIGAFAVVQAWTLLLDFGLTPTLNREIVRARSGTRSWQSLADLVRSIEVIVVILATLLALAVWSAAPMLANIWLKPEQIQPLVVVQAIALMGAVAAVRWLEQVYRGAIQGSEDQVWLSLVQAGTETARWGGALLVIRFISPDILLFFLWNLCVSICSVLILRRRVRAFLCEHGCNTARVRLAELSAVRRFAGGMFLSSLLAFLLTQADKLIVGGYVPLADFGIYALAATATAGLLQLVQPMNVAILPRFTALLTAQHEAEMIKVFNAASQWLAAIVLPVGLLVVFLPHQVLMGWTGQTKVAVAGANILSLLMLASIMNALANIPYMLQLAHGWTSITNKLNAAVIVVMLPVMIWATTVAAGVGAAATLVTLNLISLIVMSALVLPRLLPGQLWRWWTYSILVPSVAGGSVALALRLLLPTAHDQLTALIQLGVSGFIVGLFVLAALHYPRKSLVGFLSDRLSRASRQT